VALCSSLLTPLPQPPQKTRASRHQRKGASPEEGAASEEDEGQDEEEQQAEPLYVLPSGCVNLPVRG